MLERALYSVSDNVILLEAPGLASRSKLRSAMEKRQDVAVIACYPEEGRSLSVALRTMFDAAQVRVDRDAMAWLSSVLPADRAVIRQEVEKLILFAEPSAPLSLDDVQLCIGDTRAESLSNATSSALAVSARRPMRRLSVPLRMARCRWPLPVRARTRFCVS